jgi:ankyrin repeat protein
MRLDGLLLGALTVGVTAGCSRDLTDAVQDGTDAVRASLDESPADPNRLDANGEAAIHIATMLGQTETIHVLLEHHAAVDLVDKRGATPLMIAVELGCVPCAYELMAGGADPNFRHDKRDEFMLDRAVRSGAPELVVSLLEGGADPNVRRTDGQTPLHVAASSGDRYRSPLMASLLVEHGADIRAVDSLGETPLHTAAVYNQPRLIAYYASIGADLNAVNAWGSTPLDRAVERHQDLAAEELYELGASVRTTAPSEPPLVAAARVDDVDRARMLLIYGADPRRPFEGESAVDVARKSRSDAVLALLTSRMARR